MGETEPAGAEPRPPVEPAARQPLARRVGVALFGQIASRLLRLLGTTWRIETMGSDPRPERGSHGRGDEAGPAQLAALFHESMLACAFCYRDQSYSVAVSRSRDGDLIAATLDALGYAAPARGSSSRGGSAALRGLLRRIEAGTTVAVLVDGPRGPARVAKTGIVSLARLAGRPIQPIAFSARPALRLRSWDRSLIPLPFARVVCAYGDPIEVAAEPPAGPRAEGEREQAIARRLDETLVALHHAADHVLLTR